MFSLTSPLHPSAPAPGGEGRDLCEEWQPTERSEPHPFNDSQQLILQSHMLIQDDPFQPWSRLQLDPIMASSMEDQPSDHPFGEWTQTPLSPLVLDHTQQQPPTSLENQTQMISCVNGVEQSFMHEELTAVDQPTPLHDSTPSRRWDQPTDPPHPPPAIAPSIPVQPAIVLDANSVYPLPAMKLVPNASVAINNLNRVRAVCACIRCRKLKASCDNQRPCSRCVNSGHECIDRSEDEVKSGPGRKKRPSPSADSIDSAMTPVTTSTTSNAVLPQPSPTSPITQSQDETFGIWSRSQLNLLIQSGLRDSILKVQATFDTLPIELPNLLEWHAQVSFMCSNFAGQMSHEDFHQFLTHGLSDEILNSRLWSSSPFAPWTKLSTRPFFIVFAPLPPSTIATNPPNHPSAIPSEVAELYFEFAPSSNIRYSRFLQMQTARIMYERELSNGRIRKQPSTSPTPSATPHRSMKSYVSSGSSSSSMNDMAPDNVTIRDDSELNALTNSMSSFTILDVTTSLAVPPSTHLIQDENEQAASMMHANWCPMSSSDSKETSGGGHKLQRTICNDSVHGLAHGGISTANLDQIPLADLLASSHSSFRCICSLSTPLPSIIRINPAFERLFDWRRIEIEQNLQKDGHAWMRHLMPVESYPMFHSYFIHHWKAQITFIGEMALQAAILHQHETSGQSSNINLPSIVRPSPWLPQTARIRRKSGEIDPHLYLQDCRFQSSDGGMTPTTITISWKKMN